MLAVVQRVSRADVTVDQKVVGQIGLGFLILVCVVEDDDDHDLAWMVKKIRGLRIFEDDQGKMNLDLTQVGGQILSVSQFTLAADVTKGNRPSFVQAAKPDKAKDYFDKFNQALKDQGLSVETGIFQADMDISLVNKGPTTIILDSRKRRI